MDPQATVAVLNYERRDALRRTLQSVLAQEMDGLEVLVVDNASTDGSDRMVAEEFPGVRFLRLERNVACAARNEGVRSARAEAVVTIDNDVLLEGPAAVADAVRLLQSRPQLACVNFKILDEAGRLSRRDWCHPRDPDTAADDEFPTDYVLEGACVLRRDAFLRAGGYWGELFIGHEGQDLALRLLDQGGEILYSPRVAVRHLASPQARPSSRIYYTFTRNGIWVALRNHRVRTAAAEILKTLALMSFSSVRAGHGVAFARGVRDGVVGARTALAERRPLRKATYDRLREIRRGRPTLVAKARRHWAEKPI